MRKLYFLLIAFQIYSAALINAQNGKTTNLYNVKSLKSDNYSYSKVLGSENYKLVLLQPYHEKYFRDKVMVYSVLKSKTGEIVYSGKNNLLQVKFYPSYENKLKILKSEVKIAIPYDNMDIEKGSHKLMMEIYIENDSIKDAIVFKKEIVVEKPELFNYNEQEITIINFRAQDQAEFKGLKGIKVSFERKFKFSANQTKGISFDNNLAFYYFNVTAYDKADNRICYDKKESDLSIIKSNSIENINFEKVTLFIPYRNLLLSKGKHEISIELKASYVKETVIFNNLALKTVNINQPQVYIVDFKAEDFKIAYGKYDASSELGRIFSKQGSNKGYGYPDVYWNLKIGEYSIYNSSISHNSFTAPNGSVKFKIVDDEKIYLSAYDRDALNADDFIGLIEIGTEKGEFKKIGKTISKDSISNVKYSIVKNKLPNVEKAEIDLTENLNNKSNGYNLDLSFIVSNLLNNNKLQILPFIKRADSIINIAIFDVLVDNFIKKDSVLISSNSYGNLKLFIPQIILLEKDKLGFQIFDSENNILLGEKISNQNINNIKKNDIKYKIGDIKEYTFNGINGIIIKVSRNIPEFYTKLNLEIFLKTSLGLVELSDNQNLTDKLIPVLKEDNEQYFLKNDYTDLNYFNFNADGLYFFLPYFYVPFDENKREFELKFETFYTDNHKFLGAQKEKFTLKKAALKKINILDANLKYKEKIEFKKIRVKILFSEFANIEKNWQSVENKINIPINAQFIAHEKDKMQLYLYYEDDEFGLEKILIKNLLIDFSKMKTGTNILKFKNKDNLSRISLNIELE
ncbi:MAG: hypothetical protein JXA16_13240 [Bacteroidales bacterium]|nr:hypothetical protein [Bacteroidales bacterium]